MASDENILDTSKLSFEGDFDTQVQDILQTVRLSRHDVENLGYMMNDLQAVFQNHWPGCDVQAFGSIVTGLGIKTSDMDCFVKLPNGEQATYNTVYIAKGVLMRYTVFGQIIPIPAAKVPIVKFLYHPSKSHCDVSFKSPSGVHNSRLIACLLNADPEILNVAVLIKYWSKVHMLTGTHLVSNYSLTLLVIFYFQQINVLPSVHEMQRDIDGYFVDNWNTAFDGYAVKPGQNISIYEMLGGFFKFYSTFNFNDEVVSTFLGKPIKKEMFKEFDDVPSEYFVYKINLANDICEPLKINSKVCIQDPFEHSRNCSSGVNPRLLKKFFMYIAYAARKFDEDKDSFLREILTERTQPRGNQANPKPPGPAKPGKKFQNKVKGNVTNCYQQLKKLKKGNKN